MTTPDPTGNGSREPNDRPTPGPADEPRSHPSGVPAAGAEPGRSCASPDGDPLTLAAPEGSEALSGEATPDETGYPPIPAMPVEPPPTLADHASGSSPDETPTAPQPTVPGGRTSRDEPRPISPPPSGQPPPSTEPRSPDWSTPETPAVAPPLGGTPPQQPPAGPPYPPAHGPPPAGPPGRPPRRRRTVALILGLTAALLACCCASVVGGLVAVGDGLFGFVNRGRRTVGLNETARDGNLEFRVAGVQCNVPRVGDQYVSQRAVGQFCLVDVTVRNAGDRPATFDDSLQRAYGPGDRQFGVDQTAGMIVNAAQPLFLAPINPGNQVNAVLVYDIPTDTRLARILLRASADSRGVLVKV